MYNKLYVTYAHIASSFEAVAVSVLLHDDGCLRVPVHVCCQTLQHRTMHRVIHLFQSNEMFPVTNKIDSDNIYPRRPTEVGVGWTFESVCLSVCPQHNSKMNDPKVFTLGRPILV